MSTTDATFKIHRDGETKTFEDEQAFKDTVDLLKDNGVDFDVEQPDDSDDQETDGGQRENGQQSEPDVIDTKEVSETTVVDDAPDEPPERSITDDPVDWIGSVGEFTYTKNGKTAINKKGLRVLQYWYEIDNPESEIQVGPEETDHTYCRVRAEAEIDGRTAVAHGSAHVDRGDDPWLLAEMADTRAKSRVILDITGMGAVAVSELQNEL